MEEMPPPTISQVNKKERNSNIELLRIIAAMGVVALHFNEPFSFDEVGNLWSVCFVSSTFGCAVNLFILISGYFSCYSDKRSLGKPFSLVLQLIILREIYYFIQIILGCQAFSVQVFIGWMVPNNYFVILFIALYFISPYINMVMKSLSNKERVTMVLLCFVLFSVWPTLSDIIGDLRGKPFLGLSSIAYQGSLSGYSIVNFVLLYIIGAYLRMNNLKFSKTLSIYLLMIVVITILAKWNYNRANGALDMWAWSYCNPLVIIESVSVFLLFVSFDFKSRAVNNMAKAAYTCYLLHGFLLPYLNIGSIVSKGVSYYFLYLILVMLALYFFSYIVYLTYNYFTSGFISKLDKYQIPYKN